MMGLKTSSAVFFLQKIFVIFFLCSHHIVYADKKCSATKLESADQFLSDLSLGKIDLIDRIDLPFSTYYAFCPKGEKSKNQCVYHKYYGIIDNLSLVDEPKKEKKAKRKNGTDESASKKSEDEWTVVIDRGPDQIAILLRNLKTSGLLHVQKGVVRMKSDVSNKNEVLIKLYTLENEWFRTFEGRYKGNCLMLYSQYLRTSKDESDPDDPYPISFGENE